MQHVDSVASHIYVLSAQTGLAASSYSRLHPLLDALDALS